MMSGIYLKIFQLTRLDEANWTGQLLLKLDDVILNMLIYFFTYLKFFTI